MIVKRKKNFGFHNDFGDVKGLVLEGSSPLEKIWLLAVVGVRKEEAGSGKNSLQGQVGKNICLRLVLR